ncbi:MAG: GH92 family glycosyl hydrolase [Candidatus Cryptobacteroides sp.]
MKRIIISAMLLAGLNAFAQTPAEYVNTTIGTKLDGFKSGYCVPGATVPFGMVQFSTPIAHKEVGFGVNQVNAGCPHQANFPTLPMKGKVNESPGKMTEGRVRVTNERGHAGYYQANVHNNIKAEFTATTRTGYARYEFPESEEFSTVLIGAGIAASRIEKAAMVITSPHSCEGYSDGGDFCGIKTPYTIYFAAEFDTDAEISGTWKKDRLRQGSTFAEGEDSGVYFTFRNTGRKIGYKFAISYVSVDNAKENLNAENPGWDFDKVREEAEAAWNKCLSKIEVKGTDRSRIIQFYTHLYHVYMHPNIFNDVNGEYIGADGEIHRSGRTTYTNFSNWDTYRTQIQLLAMLEPEVASDIVVSHQRFAEQAGGAFPRWVMSGIETGIMQGEPTSALIANAWAFGARNFLPDPVFSLMRKSGETYGLKCQGVEARPYLKDYLEKGYTYASLQLEYTTTDFAISRFAIDACNDAFASAAYAGRAATWKNLYNPETGWLQCRDEYGDWRPFTNDWKDYDEATYKTYFWMVPFDIGGLIDIMGGKEMAEKRLDELFRRVDASPFDDWFPGGNEPGFQIPWIYNWVGRPDKTSAVINRILNELYYVGEGGLPGNDDLGTMGAWYVFACTGLYPMIPGVGGFTLNTPVFENVVMHLPGGDLVIKGGSESRIYTKSLKVNGQSRDRAWVDFSEIEKGGMLEYNTSEKPYRKWATASMPPSF